MKNTIKSINPADESIFNEFPDWTMHEINPVIVAADQAFSIWQELSFDKRAEYFNTMAGLLRQGKSHFAHLMAREMGKPVTQGEMEIEKCAWVCEHYAQHTQQYLADRNINTENSESFVTFQPLGVIYMIMPWNFPFWQVIRGAAPTIMAGNTLVLKHASNVFSCALAIEQLFIDAGFPENVFRTLLTGSQTSADIIAHPKIQAVTLTGSERAGQQVAMEAGRNLKKSVLELGGSDPYIILEDADIDAPEAWDLTTGGTTALGDTIVVAIIDGGSFLAHEDLDFWKNSQADLAVLQGTNSSPIAAADANRSFYYPKDGSTPQTNVLAGGDTKCKAGSANQMVAGYENEGYSAAAGGSYIDYDLYSQHLGARNSEVIININWNHIIGLEDECIYD